MGEMADYTISQGFEEWNDSYWGYDQEPEPTHESFYPRRLDRGPGKCICGLELVLKEGKYGLFYGCPSFPKCKYARPYR